MTTFDWSNNYLLFQIQRKDGRPHLEFSRSFHEREEDLLGIAECMLSKRDMFVSKISDSATLVDNRSEMYHD